MPQTDATAGEMVERLTAILAGGKWWIGLTALATTLAATAAVYQLPNRYTSEATLLVVQQQVPTRYVTPTTTTDIADALQAMTQEVLSRAKLLGLIDQFNLYPGERRHLSTEELVTLMRKYIDIQPVDPVPGRKDFNAFKIAFTADKAILAQEVTSRLTSLFIQANLKTREDQATNTTNFLQEQLDAAKQKLTEQEERLRDFKMQYLGELPEQQQGNLAILSGAQLQLQNITASLDRAQQQRAYLQSMLDGYRRLRSRGASVAGLPGIETARGFSPLQTAETDLVRLQAERARLLITYSANYPDVKDTERQISATQDLIRRMKATANKPAAAPPAGSPAAPPVEADEGTEEDASIAQLRSQLESNRLEIQNLSKDQAQQKNVIDQYQSRLNLTPVREQQLAGVLRDYELSRQDYMDLLGKVQQSELAMSLEKQQGGQHFRLLEPPSLPAKPSSPKRIKITLGGAGAGIVLGLALALIGEFRNPSLRTEKEVVRRFGAPLVVALPLVRSRAEERSRAWKRVLEWCAGCALTAAVLVAELYVYRHP
ncbi:MAG TPA: Wzz/FepE/Etk N-terminal domain-containing protein [Bryobacteraceae bacterium]|nr:Wzz/FepE/Etk N-terminal domain-containing protein [Bryobacteraceae bacterium]